MNQAAFEQAVLAGLRARRLAYSQTVAGGVPVLGFTQSYDHLGRVVTVPGRPAASTTSYGYDTADRIIGGGYVYDAMGRTTTVPKTHTSQSGQDLAGNLAVTYAANDMVATHRLSDRPPFTDSILKVG